MNPDREVERSKRSAALEAVKQVKDGSAVGLGSGSTAAYAIEAIGDRMKRERLHVIGVPTSYQAFILAVHHGIPTTTLEEHPILDLTIDGADQIDPALNLIKGMGGALTREKIVASASKKNIVVADESKKVKILGEDGQCVPLEILPVAIATVVHRLKEMGGKPVLREGSGKVGPVVTDNGNVIIDLHIGLVHKPEPLAKELKLISGVVETGLFVGMTDIAYIGKSSRVEILTKRGN